MLGAIRPVLLCARRGNVGIIREGRPTKAAHCVKRLELSGERRENETRATRARRVRARIGLMLLRTGEECIHCLPRDPQPVNFVG